MKSKTVVIVVIVFVGLLLLCCMCAGGYYFIRNYLTVSDYITEEENNLIDESSDNADNDEVQPDAGETTEEESPDNELATITGTVTYPSEFIPEGLEICAESTVNTEEYCTTDLIESMDYYTGFGYELEVPAGSYYVYAVNEDMDPNYKAYYSEFVTCGLSVECPSHDPILVVLLPGQTATEIDPGDWYGE